LVRKHADARHGEPAQQPANDAHDDDDEEKKKKLVA
jgi:hypothetical protein